MSFAHTKPVQNHLHFAIRDIINLPRRSSLNQHCQKANLDCTIVSSHSHHGKKENGSKLGDGWTAVSVYGNWEWVLWKLLRKVSLEMRFFHFSLIHIANGDNVHGIPYCIDGLGNFLILTFKAIFDFRRWFYAQIFDVSMMSRASVINRLVINLITFARRLRKSHLKFNCAILFRTFCRFIHFSREKWSFFGMVSKLLYQGNIKRWKHWNHSLGCVLVWQ